MKMRWLASLIVPLLCVALGGGECNSSSPQTQSTGDSYCETPVYEPETGSVDAVVDAPFLYYVYPTIESPTSHNVTRFSILAGSLPPGLELDYEDPDWLGAVTGVPTETGSWESVVEALVECDDGQELTAELTLTIDVGDDCVPIEAPAELVITGEPGEYIIAEIVATGGIGTLSYALSGELPPGMHFDGEVRLDPFVGFTGRGEVSGTWNVTVTVSDGCPDQDPVEIPVTIELACPPLYGSPDIYVSAELGDPVSYELDMVGGAGTLSYTLVGDLPAGVEFDGETEVDAFTGFTGTASESGLWELTLTVTDECPDQQSIDIPVTITITEPGATVPPGVYDCSLLGPEALWCERYVDFGSLHPPYCAGAGVNGWAVLSLADPFFGTLASQNYGPYWGAIPLAGGPAGSGYTARALFSYGQYGVAVQGWDDGWGLTALWGADAVSDACGLDDSAGAADRSGLSYCLPGPKRVWGVHYNEEYNIFTTFGGFIDGAYLQGGTPRSSCPLEAGQGKVFILTDAEGGEDGKLFCGDFNDPYADCDYIGDIGSQPVCVRKEGNVWAASDFADDTVTCGLVNSGSDAEITITVSVGDGPYRLDLTALGNGNTAIGCAGFNDSSFSVIVVDALGQLVSESTQALPAGVTAPGGVAFLPDDSHNLVVSGNATNNIAVVDTGLGN